MDGVILFVDDKIDDYKAEGNQIKRSLENELFETLRKDYPVLGVRNLDLAEKAIKSIGSFSAIILDWIFDDTELLLQAGEDEDELRGLRVPRDGSETLDFLKRNDFYSPVYVFSNENVKEQWGKELTKKFSKRIKFKKKSALGNQANKIAIDIKKWREKHQSLEIPSLWTKTINQSVQKIFVELACADENWLRELGKSAESDGGSGEVFIIEILQYLLAESLIQDKDLINAIRNHLDTPVIENAPIDEKSVAKLFRRLFYTELSDSAPIMTGDICKISRNKFGIIVTPECDIKDVIKNETKTFELLTFSRKSFDDFLQLQKNYQYSRNDYGTWSVGNNKQKEKLENLRKRFNQDDAKYHILPSFPFNQKYINQSVVIDFSEGCERYSSNQIKNRRTYKLNSPFIQQLRQRYISHLGRVGSPSLPESVRNFNLRK